MSDQKYQHYRKLPSVHKIITKLENNDNIRILQEQTGTENITVIIRQVLDKARQNIAAAEAAKPWILPPEEFAAGLWSWIENETVSMLRKRAAGLRPLINATGVILHTNCGRALLAPAVADFVREQACCYSNLELDVWSGERGSRYDHVERLLCDLTGAEAALVVNNNAAAVLLVMNTLAAQREVLVSRGELVEVGGSFRMPGIIEAGGAKLVEVGTTNKTWLKDYETAISPESALLLKVHTSNYIIEGFTQSVSGKELVKLGQEWQIPVVEDLGSGTFYDGVNLGLPAEPTIGDSIKTGFSLVTFSGDKLLGGPQAGIIIGKSALIARLRNNQLLRVLRIDKLSLAALEGTLRIYKKGRAEEIPVWKMLGYSIADLQTKARLLESRLQKNGSLSVELQTNFSRVGGGAWPAAKLPTWVCAVRPNQGSAEDLQQFLRQGEIPILARIHKDWVLLDVRTLLDNDLEKIAGRLQDWQPDSAQTGRVLEPRKDKSRRKTALEEC
ncbi:MAG TPA: L-seryl-tRNA(Sec) selenium transferase [Desulfitobacteriaceae bacterium]|nr:L-seryl-tRNA(Sec) selenium transferase [Desulfitobacteriaceae bacterium]